MARPQRACVEGISGYARGREGPRTFSELGRSTVEMTGYASSFFVGERATRPSLLSRRMNGLSERRDFGDSSSSLPDGTDDLTTSFRTGEPGSFALTPILGAGEVGMTGFASQEEAFLTGGSHGIRPPAELALAAFWYSVSGLGGGVHFLRGTCGSGGLSGAACFSKLAISSLLAKRLPLPEGRLPGIGAPPSTRDIKSMGIADNGLVYPSITMNGSASRRLDDTRLRGVIIRKSTRGSEQRTKRPAEHAIQAVHVRMWARTCHVACGSSCPELGAGPLRSAHLSLRHLCGLS